MKRMLRLLLPLTLIMLVLLTSCLDGDKPAESAPHTDTVAAQPGGSEYLPEVTAPSEPETIPAETIPAETIPAETIPAETIPAETIPTETIPVETIPTETIPVETIPTETIPAETVPGETQPMETEPAETETAPEETKPGETQPCTHDFGDWKTTKEATCQAEGEAIRTCADCGATEKDVLSKLNHAPETIPGKKPTCTIEGKTEGKRCSVCFEMIVVPGPIPPKGHQFEDGMCAVCGEACDHAFGGWSVTKPADCTEAGEETRTCASCRMVQSRTVSSLGHSGVVLEIVSATCTTDGYTVATCARCTETFYTGHEPAKGHHFSDYYTVTELTCTQDGLYRRDCDNCDVSEEIVETTNGHQYNPLSEDEEGTIIYVCVICQQQKKFKTAQEAHKEDEYLRDCSPTFTFDVMVDGTEEEVRSLLTLSDLYLKESGEGYAEYASVPYVLTSLGDGIWRVTPERAYEAGYTYEVILSGDASFVKYAGNTLTFTITDEASDERDFADDIIFVILPDEEDALYGYFDLWYDESADRLYFQMPTRGRFDDDHVGRLVCIGDYTSTEEILNEPGRECNFGKIEAIRESYDGSCILVLTCPTMGEIYEELDLYTQEKLQISEEDIPEEYEEYVVRSFREGDDLAEFAAEFSLAAERYATDNGLMTVGTADGSFMDNLKLTPDVSVKDNKIKAAITGKLSIDLKTKAGKKFGTLSASFVSECYISYDVTAQYEITKHWYGQKMERFDLDVAQTTGYDFKFNVTLESEYSLGELTPDTLKDVYMTQTSKLHLSSCHQLKNYDATTLTKVSPAELDELFRATEGGCLISECPICRPMTTYMQKRVYIVNNTDKSVHAYHSFCPARLSEDTKMTCELPRQADGYTYCAVCGPEKVLENTFKNYYFRNLDVTNWDETVSKVKEVLKQKGATQPKDTGRTLLKKPFILLAIVEIDLELDLTMHFKMEGSVEYHYSVQNTNRYGLRMNAQKTLTPYFEKGGTSSTSSLELLGKVEVKMGLEVSISVTLTGFHSFVHIGFSAEGGIYSNLTGIYHVDFKTAFGGEDERYDAIYLEVGLYYDMDFFYKLFFISGRNDVDEGKRPLLAVGYNKVYYGYGTNCEEKTVYGSSFSMDPYDTLNVLYFDVRSMTTGKDTLSIYGEEGKYRVVVTVCDENGNVSPHARIRNGRIVMDDQSPCEVDLYVVYRVIGVDDGIQTADELWRKSYSPQSVAYTMEDYVMCLHVVNHRYAPYVTVVEPKCNEEGLEVSYASCGCTDEQGELLKIEQAIPATGIHAYSDWEVTIPSTCTEKGLESRFATCNCKNEDGTPKVQTRVTAALDHDTVIVDAIPVTCTTDGYTEGRYCDRCKVVFLEIERIPAPGHRFEDEFTCHDRKCLNTHLKCTYVSYATTPHRLGDELIFDIPDHEGLFFTAKICLDCATMVDQSDNAFTHNWNWEEMIYVLPTCTKKGYVTLTCRDEGCGLEVTESLAMLPHTFVVEDMDKPGARKSPATCTASSVYYLSCIDCGGLSEDADEAFFYPHPPLGHQWEEAWSKDGKAGTHYHACENNCGTRMDEAFHVYDQTSRPILKSTATCYAPAYYYYTCICGHYERNGVAYAVGSPLEHEWSSVWSKDSDKGTHYHACENDCDERRDERVHVYDQMTDTVLKSPATCHEPAYYYYTCVCGYYEKDGETYAKGGPLEHEWSLDWSRDPVKGTHYHACRKGCGDRRDEALHVYDQMTDAVLKSPATCKAPAYYYYTCVCGHHSKYGETYAKGSPLEHDWSSAWTKDPVSGTHYHTCKNGCDARRDETPHTYDQATDVALKSPATCEEPAYYYYTCICGHYEKGGETYPKGAPLDHDWSSAWTKDLSKGTHYHACMNGCGERSGEARHVYDGTTDTALKSPATCYAPAYYHYTCICGHYEKNGETYAKGDPLEHVWSEEWSKDYVKDTHYHACENGCNERADEAAHTTETPICGSRSVCDVCCVAYGEVIYHQPDGEWHTDEASHWQICQRSTCGQRIKESRHSGGAAPTCRQGSECEICGYLYLEAVDHDPATTWTRTDGEHYRTCRFDCGYVFEDTRSNHVGGIATCTVGKLCVICGYEYTPPRDHDWDETGWLYDKTHHYRICVDCGAESTGEKHLYDQRIISSEYFYGEADCEHATRYYKSCVCGQGSSRDTDLFDVGEPLGHLWDDELHYNTVGHYYQCLRDGCDGKDFAIHTLDQKIVEDEYLKAVVTCTKPAEYYYVCVCGYCARTAYYQNGEPMGHALFEDSWEISENGMTHYHKCLNQGCDARFDEAPHSGVPATCTEAAVCDACGAEYQEPLGHRTDWEQGWLADPVTDTHYHACVRCLEHLDVTAHAYTKKNTDIRYRATKATCTEKATYYYSCECGLTDPLKATFENGNPKGHTYGWAYTEAEHYRQCTTEDCLYVDETTRKPHRGGTVTCEKPAVCTDCKYEYIAAWGHKMSTEWSADERKHWHACENPGCDYREDTRNHTFGAYVQTLPPTCAEEGREIRTCSVCLYEDGRTIEKLPHVWDDEKRYVKTEVDESRSTEETTYYIHYIMQPCMNCDEEREVNRTDSVLYNTFDTEFRAPTCTENGYLRIIPPTDAVNGEIFEETIPALGHDRVKGKVISPTCTEEGYTEYRCLRCGDIEKRELVPPTGHRGYVYTISATCTEEGYEVTACEVCGEELGRMTISPLGHDYGEDGYCRRCKEQKTSEGLEFVSNGDGTCYVSGSGTCKDLNLVIPAVSPEGDTVTSVGYRAFYSDALTSVTIPDSVKHIEGFAFAYCRSLKNIVFSENLRRINGWAFAYCEGLTSIEIPEKMISIDASSFSSCKNLTSITIHKTTKNIDSSAFSGCYAITDIYYQGSRIDWLTVTVGESNGSLLDATIHFAETEHGESQGLEFVSNGDGTCYVSGIGTCTDVDLVIPSMSPDGDIVTAIGEYALYQCSLEFRSIVIPDSVKRIEDYAIGHGMGQSKLEVVIISGGVTHIGQWAFVGHFNLKYVELPNTLISIGQHAFSSSKNLRSIELPDGLTEIQHYAFSYCESLQSMVIPDSVTSLGYSIFDGCESLESVTLGKGITEIGDYLFSNCTGLTSFVVPDFITYIGKNAFEDCYSLRNIVIPDSVTSIGNYVFWNCSGLESIVFPDSVTSIGDMLFMGCYSLKSITFPHIVTDMGDSQFDGCDKLETVVLPSNLTSISGLMFSNCRSLKALEIPASVTSIGDHAFDGCGSLESIVIPDQVIHIGIGAFYACHSLTEISIPHGVTTIEQHTFSNCTTLAVITIPDSVKQIDSYAFHNCSALTDVYYDGTERQWNFITIQPDNDDLLNATIHFLEPDTAGSQGLAYTPNGDGTCYVSGIGECTDTEIVIPRYSPEGDQVTGIAPGAFMECAQITDLVIPDGITTIGDAAFSYCVSLKRITIPASVETIGYAVLGMCSSLESVVIDPANPRFVFEGNCLIDLETKTLLSGFANSVIPADGSVAHIGMGAFIMCTELADLVIPEGVLTIGDMAFVYCISLTEISLPQSLQTIGTMAFSECENLVRADLPAGLTSIGAEAFSYCSALESVTIPGGVQSIAEYTFRECIGIKTLIISEGVTSIGKTAFYRCRALRSVSLPDSLTSIGASAFCDCYALTDIILSENLAYIGDSAFDGCTALTELVIPQNVISIGTGAFSGCKGLEKVTILASLTEIPEACFSGCGKLTQLVLPDNLTSIGDRSFSGTGLLEVVIPENVESIGERAFSSTPLLRIVIPKNVVSVGDMAFRNCSGLTELVISGSKTSFGERAFAGCESLSEVTFAPGMTDISLYMFADCTGLVSVALPDGLNLVGTGAFTGCTALTALTIPGSVKTINPAAFEGCESLADVYYGGDRHEWLNINICIENEPLLNATIHYGEIAGNTSVGLEYTSNGDGTCFVSGLGTCTDVSIVIPGVSPDGETVTGIGAYAFEGYAGILRVVIPEGVTSIGDRAFNGCELLETVEIPYGVLSIGESAFSGCVSLEVMNLPESIVSIGEAALADCDSLSHVTLPSGLTAVADRLFQYCDNLKSVKLPDDITSIGEWSFEECISLTSLDLPDGVTHIGDFAFRNCSALTEIRIPDGVTVIGMETFWGCDSLESVEIPGSVTAIEQGAFEGCISLQSIVIPEGVGYISYRAFENCANLQSITLPESLWRILDAAFNECVSLSDVYYAGTPSQWNDMEIYDENEPLLDATVYFAKSDSMGVQGLIYTSNGDGTCVVGGMIAYQYGDLIIPTVSPLGDTVTGIAENGFLNNEYLLNVEIPDSVTCIGQGAFAGCAILSSVCISDGITEIADFAFSGCMELMSIEIPASVTRIGDYAFDQCDSLARVFYMGTESGWGCIAIGGCNECLSLATIYFLLR